MTTIADWRQAVETRGVPTDTDPRALAAAEPWAVFGGVDGGSALLRRVCATKAEAEAAISETIAGAPRIFNGGIAPCFVCDGQVFTCNHHEVETHADLRLALSSLAAALSYAARRLW